MYWTLNWDLPRKGTHRPCRYAIQFVSTEACFFNYHFLTASSTWHRVQRPQVVTDALRALPIHSCNKNVSSNNCASDLYAMIVSPPTHGAEWRTRRLCAVLVHLQMANTTWKRFQISCLREEYLIRKYFQKCFSLLNSFELYANYKLVLFFMGF